jgi:hypothetical protein
MIYSLFTIVTGLNNKDINFVFQMRYFGPFIHNLRPQLEAPYPCLPYFKSLVTTLERVSSPVP